MKIDIFIRGIFLSAIAIVDRVMRRARHPAPRCHQHARTKVGLLDQGNLMAIYPVSTSKFGLGDFRGSNRTPLGELQVADKIGDGAAPGTVFKDRRRTGEIIAVDAPGRDPIVTRILWLRGREPQNANAYARTIYIHGTPEERNIGRPASYGCIRMRSSDIISLYGIVGRGAQVTIVDLPLAAVVAGLNPADELLGSRFFGWRDNLGVVPLIGRESALRSPRRPQCGALPSRQLAEMLLRRRARK